MTDALPGFVVAALITFVALFLLVPAALLLMRTLGLYTIVDERTCQVYVLFGKVVGIVDEPGPHLLPLQAGRRRIPRELGRAAPCSRHAARSGIPAQPACQL